MMNQPFDENVYVIDLSYVKSASEIIYDLSSVLDSEEARNRRVCLKLGDIELNQSQILSIKSLINSINSTLSFVDTTSASTENAVLALGIVLSSSSASTPVTKEPEMTYKSIDEVINSIDEAKENAKNEESNNQESSLPVEYYSEYEKKLDEIQLPSTPRGYEKLTDHSDEISDEIEETASKEDEQQEIKENQEQQEETEKTDIVEDNTEIQTIEEPENIEDRESQAELSDIVLNIPSSEEIKEELDTIFNSEKKLEEIFESSTPQDETGMIEKTEIIQEEKSYTEDDLELDRFETKYMKQTIRSGQVINFEGNIVIIGDCHPGSEIIASGDITVWGVLSGIAHAGSKGNKKARIRALKMNAIQLRLADCYARRPDALNTIFVEKTNTFTPEEARIVKGEIVIFKVND